MKQRVVTGELFRDAENMKGEKDSHPDTAPLSLRQCVYLTKLTYKLQDITSNLLYFDMVGRVLQYSQKLD